MIGSADRVTWVYDIIIILIMMLMSLGESSYRWSSYRVVIDGSLTVRSLKMLFLFNRFELTCYYCLSNRVFRQYFHDLNTTYLNKNWYKFKLTLLSIQISSKTEYWKLSNKIIMKFTTFLVATSQSRHLSESGIHRLVKKPEFSFKTLLGCKYREIRENLNLHNFITRSYFQKM